MLIFVIVSVFLQIHGLSAMSEPGRLRKGKEPPAKQVQRKSQEICETHCVLPKGPAHGQYMVLGSHLHVEGSDVPNGTVLHYSCDPGFAPVPASTAMCQCGKWNGNFKECQVSLCCILPEFPPFGNYITMDSSIGAVPGGEVPEWTIIKYSCEYTEEHGHDMHISICRKGSWSKGPPACQTMDCVIPDCPRNVECSTVGDDDPSLDGEVVPNWTVLEYACPPELTIVGSSTSVCHRGKWSHKPPTCANDDSSEEYDDDDDEDSDEKKK